ncbi:MAG: CBS domain-containing protein [Halobacteriota archaeon]
MLIEDIMTRDVVTIDADASLQAAVVSMLRSGVGSVIVERDGVPSGICTETDALLAAAKTERPLTAIPVSGAMTSDLVTGSADMTVRKAIRTMSEHGIKKLPITAEFDVVGIVTMTDVVHHHSELIGEAHRLESDRSRWSED